MGKASLPPRSFRPLLLLFCVALAVRRTLLFWMRVYFLGVAAQNSVRLHVTWLMRPQTPASVLRFALHLVPGAASRLRRQGHLKAASLMGRASPPAGHVVALFAAASPLFHWRSILLSISPLAGGSAPVYPARCLACCCSAKRQLINGSCASSRRKACCTDERMEPATGSSQLTFGVPGS
jgi:hypothetical protein